MDRSGLLFIIINEVSNPVKGEKLFLQPREYEEKGMLYLVYF
jgi:hypothetical protein